LQIAVRKFVPAKHHGPAVLLVAVCHIGDKAYYHTLQQLLDRQTLVLFEGVNAGSHPRRVRGPVAPASADSDDTPSSRTNQPPGLQSSLATSLGLVFQLEAIDYDRTNFLNSDLSIEEISRLISGAGASAGGPPEAERPGRHNASFDYLMQAMDGSSFLGSIARMAMQFLGSNPRLQAITRLMFIEALGQLKGDLATAQGMPPDMQQLIKVLIQARNEAVLKDMVEESKTVPRSGSIAIFYGTGHMDDMEQRLTRQLHYRPAGETWLTAFSVDLRQTGLTSAQIETLRGLVKWQMDQLQQ
jgi:hypothetical protein